MSESGLILKKGQIRERKGFAFGNIEKTKHRGGCHRAGKAGCGADGEGGVTIDDCENLSRAMDQILDDADPISQSYYFEVSSPGIGRDLVRPWHFQRYLGQDVQVKLIRPVKTQDGKNLREFVAPMTGCDDQTVTVELEGEPFSFSKKDAAYIRLYEEIDWKSGR